MLTRLVIHPTRPFAILSLAFVFLYAVATPTKAQEPSGASIELKIVFTEADRDVAAELRPLLAAGREQIETYFGEPFAQPFEVEIHPDRAAFDAFAQDRWKVAKTEVWMVASGVADRLTILSPRVWKTEAVEHDPADAEHLRDLLVHELVHVYHGQHNPRPDFDGMDEVGWLAEGLAVYVSKQLEHEHRHAARDAIQAGKAPAELATAWSGRYRYGVSGSLVEYIASKYGKVTIKKLMKVTTNAEVLALLGTTESDLIAAWKTHVAAQE